MSNTIHRCMTKATTAEGENVRRSANWAFSRRGILTITHDALISGNWTIPYDEINQATLYQLRGTLFPGYILAVKTGDKTYQFGLNPGRFWRGDLPFPVQRETARLCYSWFSIALRFALVIMLIHWIWKRFPL